MSQSVFYSKIVLDFFFSCRWTGGSKTCCNFSDHNFTTELFGYVSELVWTKLDMSGNDNLPQLGPLLVDMKKQRQVILAKVLGTYQ